MRKTKKYSNYTLKKIEGERKKRKKRKKKREIKKDSLKEMHFEEKFFNPNFNAF